jgi:hypothetical protein
MLVFEGGHDGIIIWTTEKYLPLLCYSPNVGMPSSRGKQYLLFQSSEMGLKIFKQRQLLKEKMQDLRFTTVIFNFDSLTPAIAKAITLKFEQYCRTFFSDVLMRTEVQLLQENITHGERICDILGIDRKQLIHKLLQL